jgi:hypothetical protein
MDTAASGPGNRRVWPENLRNSYRRGSRLLEDFFDFFYWRRATPCNSRVYACAKPSKHWLFWRQIKNADDLSIIGVFVCHY